MGVVDIEGRLKTIIIIIIWPIIIIISIPLNLKLL